MAIVLDEQQRRAIEHLRGPMLVVAGAGTGKTTVLVERIARLIREGYAGAGEVLAVTYTENAAQVLRERVEKLVGKNCRDLQATTFHAYCNSILHRAGQSFGVVDEIDLYVYLRRRISELPLEFYSRAASPGQFLEALTDFFSRCHDELVTADDYARYVEEVAAGKWPLPRVVSSKQLAEIEREEALARCREISAVYTRVEQMLREENLGTFGHMILRAVQLLRGNPETLERERARARFLLIDEFQDANLAQIELAQLLAGTEQNVFAVGDPDQAIYRFRGASSAAFAEFARRFPLAKAVVLGKNRRSGPAVLHCAHAVIANNPEVHCVLDDRGACFQRRALESARAERAQSEGRLPLWPPVQVVACNSDEQEAAEIAAEIDKILGKPARQEKPSVPRIGVLYRLHSHRDHIVRELAARNIGFSVRGINALETAEVRDLLACLRVMHTPPDSESLFRVAALPMFGLDAETVREALAAAGRDAEFESVLRSLEGGQQVIDVAEQARAAAQARGMKATAAVEIAIQSFALEASSPAVEAFRTFVSVWERKAITVSKTLVELLEYLEFFAETAAAVELPVAADEDDPNVVRLMTVHSAKGLEFDHVFLVRLNQSSFPTNYREKLFEFPRELRKSVAAEGDSTEIHRQEERRLFYVGLTRARDSLALYARASRSRKDPRPQGFVRELMDSPLARNWWASRTASAYRTALAAASATAGVAQWLMIAPSARLRSPSLSATAIESYDRCPLQFKLRRDWKIPGRVSAALHFGQAVHTVLKDFYDVLKAGRRRTLQQVMELFRAQLEAAHVADPVQRALYLRDGERHLTRFVSLHAQQDAGSVLDTERSFEIKIGAVAVRGRVDRIDRIEGERVTITDYKTGAVRDQRYADQSLQLSIYAIAARDSWKLHPERLVLYNLADNSTVETSRTKAELESARERVQEVAARIAQGDFDPTPGYHCRSCAYRRLCPATEQDVALPVRAAEAGASSD